MRSPQGFFIAFAFADVPEDQGRTAQFALVVYRCAGVFDGDTGAVGFPEYFIVAAVHETVIKGGIDGALFFGVGRAVLTTVVM